MYGLECQFTNNSKGYLFPDVQDLFPDHSLAIGGLGKMNYESANCYISIKFECGQQS